jgi:hypothetical protein
MVGTIDEKKAKVEELEVQLEGFIQRTKIVLFNCLLLDRFLFIVIYKIVRESKQNFEK